MPLLGFHARFAPLVESGQKRQTIRAYRKDGRDPKVGDRLYLWTGLRQPGARKLGEAACLRVEEIVIDERGASIGRCDGMRSGGVRLRGVAADRFARADGFASWDGLVAWFRSTHGLPFRGLLIRWESIEREG